LSIPVFIWLVHYFVPPGAPNLCCNSFTILSIILHSGNICHYQFSEHWTSKLILTSILFNWKFWKLHQLYQYWPINSPSHLIIFNQKTWYWVIINSRTHATHFTTMEDIQFYTLVLTVVCNHISSLLIFIKYICD
jgi:hypothetical protein